MLLPIAWETYSAHKNDYHELLLKQDIRARNLLNYAWDNSIFYQEFYRQHHINKQDLWHLPFEEIPMVNKAMLMDRFDDLVTNTELKKKDIESWIASTNDISARYLDKHHIVHTSGSSGESGIFIHDHENWQRSMMTILMRLSRPTFGLKRYPVVFVGAVDGHYCGASFTASAPSYAYRTRLISIYDDFDRIVAEINAFQPKQMIGYALSIVQLAKAALAGVLKVKLTAISTAGESLSAEDRHTIKEAWGIDPINLYKASEALIIASKQKGQNHFRVYEDLNRVEVVSADGRAMKEGAKGNICITNLSNKTMPLIRYRMDDLATKIAPAKGENYSRLSGFIGRENPMVSMINNQAEPVEIHPSLFEEFFVPGLLSYQFFVKPNLMQLKYVANTYIDEVVRHRLMEILIELKVEKNTRLEIERIPRLVVNSKTGKFKLISLLD